MGLEGRKRNLLTQVPFSFLFYIPDRLIDYVRCCHDD
nr:MAG TPA: hypothetical protein [Caudoviricetes sp.]